MRQKGFSRAILLGTVVVLILAGASGFLISQEKKIPGPETYVIGDVTSPVEPALSQALSVQSTTQSESKQKSVSPSLLPVPPTAPPAIIFVVTVPENTPKDDTVWVYIWQTPYKMEKVADFVYRLALSEAMLKAQQAPVHSGALIRYRYSRNGYEFRTAEYLEPTIDEPDRDTSDYFWTKQGREISYSPGKTQNDRIIRWRWFPTAGFPPKTTTIEPTETFLPRVNNMEFRSGQTIEDLYVPAFHDFFNSTAQHMKKIGYTWVEIDPPWQWTEEDGLPKIKNELTLNPNYPNDGTFLEEVKAYKREGLRVLIAPQACCTPLNTKNQPKEWWDAYFDETEKFLVHFATLAEQGDADAFMYAIPSWDAYPASINLEKEWRSIFSSIRNVFSGDVGEMIWILGPGVSSSSYPIPDTTFVTWGDTLDFFLVATEFPLSTKDSPSDEDLKEGARRVVDGVKGFYDKFHKPIIIRNGYFNVKYSWKGQALYQIHSVPWISDPEAKLKESVYEFDTTDHARTINAYFQAIAERPWVAGYFHFGYTHWEDPLSPWMSIRGKPAEDIWRKWNKLIYGL